MVKVNSAAHTQVARAVIRTAMKRDSIPPSWVDINQVRKAAVDFLNDPLRGPKLIKDVDDIIAKHSKK